MEFFFIVIVLFVLAAMSFFMDFTSRSSIFTPSSGRPLLGPIFDEVDDEDASFEASHPPVELPELGRSSASTLSSYYD